MSDLLPAKRPRQGSLGRPIQLQTNFFPFSKRNREETIHKYSIRFEPEIPAQMSRLRERIFRKALAATTWSAKFVFSNTLLFSFHLMSEETIRVTYDETPYELTITYVGLSESQLESLAFYNKFFNSVQGKLNLFMIGRKFFSMDNCIELPHKRIKILCGYSTSVQSLQGGCYVNIDLAHRCLSTVSILEQIEEMRHGPDFVTRVKAMLIGNSVITKYNNKLYKVDDIDFEARPDSNFTTSKGETLTFHEYFTKRWHCQLARMDQPMLICKVKEMTVMLVPELCCMTGVSEEVRPEVTKATKKTPASRLQSTRNLIQMIDREPKAKAELANWNVEVLDQPVQLTGRVLPAGEITMGRNRGFQINAGSGRFDRDVQSEMYEQKQLKMWGLFYMRQDTAAVNSFLSNLQACLSQCNFNAGPPARFELQSQNWQEWRDSLMKNLRPSVELIICVLPGPKNKAPMYNDLKRLLLSTYPVPSQVVLTATLRNPKSQRSIASKILIQINAKIGGIPWALKSLPVQQTMICGLDIFAKRSVAYIPAFCATIDKNCSKYISIPGKSDTPDCMVLIPSAVKTALAAYNSMNGALPRHMVIYRDGVSDYQRTSLLSTEVKSFVETLREVSPSTKLTFIVVNKCVSARFFTNPADNPPIGTVVDSNVVSKTDFDFYLLTAKANEGSMTPTHFFVVYDDSNIPSDAIQELSYRLCYQYYNWSGSVRLPAPVMYAHKLAYCLGEKVDASGPPEVHAHWSTINSLYYL